MLTTKKMRTLRRFLSLLLIVCMMLPVMVPAVDASEEPQINRIIVSLGDSYSSGEGNAPFYNKDRLYDAYQAEDFPESFGESLEDYDYLAHRSKMSWAGQLVFEDQANAGKTATLNDVKGEQWFFAASSGAETTNLTESQEKDFRIIYDEKTGQMIIGTEFLPPQLDVFDDPRLEGKTVDYVTLTMGGNDLGFTKVLIKILTGSAYLDYYNSSNNLQVMINTALLTREDGAVDGIDTTLKKAYQKIAEKAPDATILVGGYPKLLSSSAWLNPLISVAEMKLVNDAVGTFNDIIESVVQECADEGMKIRYVDVEEAFGDHGAYTLNPDDNYINNLMHARGSDLYTLYEGFLPDFSDLSTISSQIISAYSFHPNEKGVAVYRDCFQDVIDDLEKERAETEEAQPDEVTAEEESPTDQTVENPTDGEGVQTDESSGPAQTDGASGTAYVDSMFFAYLRTTPEDREDNLIVAVPGGTEVETTSDTQNGFTLVSWDGETGYIETDLLISSPAQQFDSFYSDGSVAEGYFYVSILDTHHVTQGWGDNWYMDVTFLGEEIYTEDMVQSLQPGDTLIAGNSVITIENILFGEDITLINDGDIELIYDWMLGGYEVIVDGAVALAVSDAGTVGVSWDAEIIKDGKTISLEQLQEDCSDDSDAYYVCSDGDMITWINYSHGIW